MQLTNKMFAILCLEYTGLICNKIIDLSSHTDSTTALGLAAAVSDLSWGVHGKMHS